MGGSNNDGGDDSINDNDSIDFLSNIKSFFKMFCSFDILM